LSMCCLFCRDINLKWNNIIHKITFWLAFAFLRRKCPLRRERKRYTKKEVRYEII
jgi:hypothetical protein